MKFTLESCVIEMVAEQSGVPVREIRLETRLLHDLGIDGDDAQEIFFALEDDFGVNLTGLPYDEYFGSEPSAFDILSRRRQISERKAFTVRMLVALAEQKRWIATP